MGLPRYVNGLAPNDSGNGTLGQERLHVYPSYNSGGNDFILYIATGFCYDPYPSNNQHFVRSGGIPKINVHVKPYIAANSPSEDPPIFECGFYQNADVTGWTYVSDGIWKKYFGNSQMGRVFAGAYNYGPRITDRSIGVALARATVGTYDTAIVANPTEAQILAAINPVDVYFGAQAAAGYYLYIYTGRPDVQPPAYYGGLYISGVSSVLQQGAQNGIFTVGSNTSSFEDLTFRGGPSYSVLLRPGDSSSVDQQVDAYDLRFTRIKMLACMMGVQTEHSLITDNGYRMRGIRFEYCHYDLMTNENEQEKSQDYAFISAISDAYSLASGSVDCSIYKSYCKNAGHGAFATRLNGNGTGTGLRPDRCTISYCDTFYDKWTTYSNWLGSQVGTNISIHHNTCDGATARVSLCGSVHFYKNESINWKISARKPSTTGLAIEVANGGMDNGNGSFSSGQRYAYYDLINVLAEQNTFEGEFTACIKYSHDGTAYNGVEPAMPLNAAVFKDNVFTGTFAGELRGTQYPRFLLGNNWSLSANYNTQTVINNICDIPSPNEYDCVVATKTVTTNWYAMNDAPGSTGNIATDDLKVDAAMNPLAGSPLIGTATFIGYGPDIRGVQESNPPSKGARAYQVARPSRFT